MKKKAYEEEKRKKRSQKKIGSIPSGCTLNNTRPIDKLNNTERTMIIV